MIEGGDIGDISGAFDELAQLFGKIFGHGGDFIGGGGGGSWAAGMDGGAGEFLEGLLNSSTKHWAPEHFAQAQGIIEKIIGSSEGSLGEAIGKFLSNFGRSAIPQVENYFEYLISKKIDQALGGGYSGSWEDWSKIGRGEHPELTEAAEAIKSHSLIREQLEKHASGSELQEKYTALGINLPGEDVLKKARKSLSMKLHPDITGQDGTLMAKVNDAIDVLENPEKTEYYRDMLTKSGMRKKIEEIFKDFSGKQSEFYEKVAKSAKLLLPFHGKAPEDMNAAERISHSIHEGFVNRGQFGRGAIVFTAIAGTSFLAYYLATRKEKSKNSRPAETHVEKLNQEKPQTSIAL